MKVINTALLAHPWNWAVIGLIAAFWLVFIVVLTHPANPTGEI